MARTYELKERRKRQQETRSRIVEAAVELHGTIGPARTTLSDVARRAGVQRHTLYRHFPDEWALGLACSAHYLAENPPPDPEPWRAILDPEARLWRALPEIYAYMERTEAMTANIVRDAEVDPLTRKLVELRAYRPLQERRAVLAEGIHGRRRLALLDLALEFHTWRQLVRGSGLSSRQAADLMVQTVFCGD